MTIPFLHTTAAGLFISDHRLTWVAGTRMGRRLRRFDVTHEAVADGNIQAALQRLVDRVRPPHPYVTTHLHPLHIRHAVLQGPAFDDALTFDACLQAEATRLLPPRATLTDFVMRCVVLEAGDEHTHCILAVTSTRALEQREALLASVGLVPIRIGSADIAAVEAATLIPSFVDSGAALLIVRREDAVVLHCQEGMPYAMTALPYGTSTAEPLALLEEAAALLTATSHRLVAIGEAAADLALQAPGALFIDIPVQEGTLDAGLMSNQPPISAEEVPAAALALQDLFPAPETLNFLDPSTVEERRQAGEKREAIRAILTLGSGIVLLMLILMLGGLYLTNQQMTSRAELHALGNQIARMEAAHEAVAQLEREIQHAERLVVERTHVAGLLEGVGRAVDEGLWLDAATLEEKGSTPHLTLTGAALGKNELAAYLDRLEQASFATNVRLLYSETLPQTAVYKQGVFGNRHLTRFEISLDLARSLSSHSTTQ